MSHVCVCVKALGLRQSLLYKSAFVETHYYFTPLFFF